MTGPTHKQYSVSFALIFTMLLYKFNLTSINYYLVLIIMLLVSKSGALFPDVDHTWQNVSNKTVPNWIINKLIHLTGGKHRSWQTHSIDIVVIATSLSYILPKYLYINEKISMVNMEVLNIIMTGFCAGWISHIFSDMLTSAGVRVICFIKFKIAFVPKHLGKLRFNTGNEWEAFCFKSTKIINIFIGIITLIYPLYLNGTLLNILNLFIKQ